MERQLRCVEPSVRNAPIRRASTDQPAFATSARLAAGGGVPTEDGFASRWRSSRSLFRPTMPRVVAASHSPGIARVHVRGTPTRMGWPNDHYTGRRPLEYLRMRNLEPEATLIEPDSCAAFPSL